jgi:precorrin-8X/cobalt-precorrin-8 methylmutase
MATIKTGQMDMEMDFNKKGRKIISPSAIEKSSFEIINSEVLEPRPYHGLEWQVVRRMIHTTADFELLDLVKFHPAAIDQGMTALKKACLIITDTEMANRGITRKRIDALGCQVECYINREDVIQRAARDGITRAMAAVDFAASRIDGAVLAVGNAPTALMRILDLLEEGKCRPALIVGMPVGFVNVVESKKRLMAQDMVPYLTIRGRKGGSALAATVINQLASMALDTDET